MTHPPAMHGHGQFRYCPNCAHEMAPTEIEGKTLSACSSCGYVQYHDPKVAAGVLLSDGEGRVLLMQRGHNPRKGLWSYPSGYVDAGETVENAAVRETREEVQVEVRLDGLLGVYSQEGDRVILVLYRGIIVSGDPHPGSESMAVDYFHPESLPELAFPRDARIIQDWYKTLRGG